MSFKKNFFQTILNFVLYRKIANVHYVINCKIVHVGMPVNKFYPVECNNNETENRN